MLFRDWKAFTAVILEPVATMSAAPSLRQQLETKLEYQLNQLWKDYAQMDTTYRRFFKQQGSNGLFVLAATLSFAPASIRARHANTLQNHLNQWKALFGLDNRIVLARQLFDGTQDDEAKRVVDGEPIHEHSDLAHFWNVWCDLHLTGSEATALSRLLELFASRALASRCHVRPVDKVGFVSQRADRCLYFATHAVYCATDYGKRSLDGKNVVFQALGKRLLGWFRAVGDPPNRELKMELATCLILCQCHDAAVVSYLTELEDPLVLSQRGRPIYRKGVSRIEYEIHSRVVYVNALAVVLAHVK